MKVAVVTCYFDPDYVRARTLRAGLQADKRFKTIVVKNRFTGLLRYPEIIYRLAMVRYRQNPDVYVLTFRGQEILPFVLFLAGRRPVLFDEFIVPSAYARSEPHQASFAIRVKHFLARLSEPFYRHWLRKCRFILADTQAHAELSARMSHVNSRQYRVIPVGTDETVFAPLAASKTIPADKPFEVFFYGNMLPLHGLPIMLDAIRILKTNTHITFLVAGGGKQTVAEIESLQAEGAHVTYQDWIPFDELPRYIHDADLTLGGPFGATPQAQHVITGKTYQFLACSKPVVVGISEATVPFFTDKDNALLVPQGDAEALAKAIRWAFKHRSELITIGRNGRVTYERYFSHTYIAAELKKIFDEIV